MAKSRLSIIVAVISLLAVLAPMARPAAASDSVHALGTLGKGYWMAASDGGIFNFGDAKFKGSTGNLTLNKPIVGMAAKTSGEGYWLVASDGGIFSFGDASFHGSTGAITLNKPIVGMAATPTGLGYWLVASDGGIFSFGDAKFFGSTGGIKLNKPIVGMAATFSGKGYWLVASDGGIFAFGDAAFHGSTGGTTLNQPIVGMASTLAGDGYWLVAADGGIFAFNAQFEGSAGSLKLNSPIVSMTATLTGKGYLLTAADGGIFAYGDAPFVGSTGNIKLNKPIVALALTPISPLEAPDYVVFLDGTQEVAGGEPDGTGVAFLDFTDTELCYAMVVSGMGAATAAHIHNNVQGQNGPITITLQAPDKNGVSAKCQPVDSATVKAIDSTPEHYYVNVHDADFPGGAVRGPLTGELAVVGDATNTGAIFDTEFPSFADSIGTLTGLGTGDVVRAFDGQPGSDLFYAVVVNGTTAASIWRVDPNTNAATKVTGTDFTVGSTSIGMAFDPDATNSIRITSQPNAWWTATLTTATTGSVASTTSPAYATGDPNCCATDPDVVALAFADNGASSPTGTLYGIDATNDSLVKIAGSSITTIGKLGVDVPEDNVGFDIEAATAAGAPELFLATFIDPSTHKSTAYALDPNTDFPGKATAIDIIGDGSTTYSDVALLFS